MDREGAIRYAGRMAGGVEKRPDTRLVVCFQRGAEVAEVLGGGPGHAAAVVPEIDAAERHAEETPLAPDKRAGDGIGERKPLVDMGTREKPVDGLAGGGKRKVRARIVVSGTGGWDVFHADTIIPVFGSCQ